MKKLAEFIMVLSFCFFVGYGGYGVDHLPKGYEAMAYFYWSYLTLFTLFGIIYLYKSAKEEEKEKLERWERQGYAQAQKNFLK